MLLYCCEYKIVLENCVGVGITLCWCKINFLLMKKVILGEA